MQGSHATHLGLVVGGAARTQLGHRHPVGPGPLGQRGQGDQLAGVGGHDQLPATVVGHPVLGAEGQHGLGAPDRQFGLGRAGPVVDARVDDAAVVARLVGGHRRLLVDHHDPGGG